MAGVLTPGQHRKCMSRIRSRNTKPSVRNEHLNGALFTLNHLFLEKFCCTSCGFIWRERQGIKSGCGRR